MNIVTSFHGRVQEYCGGACRQAAHRRRKGSIVTEHINAAVQFHSVTGRTPTLDEYKQLVPDKEAAQRLIAHLKGQE